MNLSRAFEKYLARPLHLLFRRYQFTPVRTCRDAINSVEIASDPSDTREIFLEAFFNSQIVKLVDEEYLSYDTLNSCNADRTNINVYRTGNILFANTRNFSIRNVLSLFMIRTSII